MEIFARWGQCQLLLLGQKVKIKTNVHPPLHPFSHCRHSTDVHIRLGRGLAREALPLASQFIALVPRDLSLSLKIGLVSNKDNGCPVCSCEVEDLVPDDGHHVETLPACDRVH